MYRPIEKSNNKWTFKRFNAGAQRCRGTENLDKQIKLHILPMLDFLTFSLSSRCLCGETTPLLLTEHCPDIN